MRPRKITFLCRHHGIRVSIEALDGYVFSEPMCDLTSRVLSLLPENAGGGPMYDCARLEQTQNIIVTFAEVLTDD